MSSAKPYESRPGWAMLYRNKSKTQDWQSDFVGVTTIDGRKFWVTLWRKTDASGEEFFSVNIRPKEER
jgi:hypothetical protein